MPAQSAQPYHPSLLNVVYVNIGSLCNTREWSITLCLMKETLLMLKQTTQYNYDINVSL